MSSQDPMQTALAILMSPMFWLVAVSVAVLLGIADYWRSRKRK